MKIPPIVIAAAIGFCAVWLMTGGYRTLARWALVYPWRLAWRLTLGRKTR